MSGAERWRCFVAVPIGDRLRDDLAAAVAAWRGAPGAENLRWTDPGAWHLTLAFLGATDPDDVPMLARTLAEVAERAQPFRLATGRLGAFPTPRAARVVWLGLDDTAGRITSLAGWVRAGVGGDEAAPFHPHITLARSRGAERPKLSLDAWARAASPPTEMVVVEQLILYRSHLGGGRPRHEVLVEAPLGARIHA